jgi:hypothetical protein
LFAEDVAKVYPDLVTYGSDGQLETVQYHKLTPVPLNELQWLGRRPLPRILWRLGLVRGSKRAARLVFSTFSSNALSPSAAFLA